MKFFKSFSYTFRHFYEGKRGYSEKCLKEGRFLFHCAEQHVFPDAMAREMDGFPRDVFDNVLSGNNKSFRHDSSCILHRDALGEWTRYTDSAASNETLEKYCPGIIGKWWTFINILGEKAYAGHVLYCKEIDELFPNLDTHTNYVDTSEEAHATFAKWKAEYAEQRSHGEPILRGGELPEGGRMMEYTRMGRAVAGCVGGSLYVEDGKTYNECYGYAFSSVRQV